MIHGENIILRPLRVSDLDEFYALYSAIEQHGDFYTLEFHPEVVFRKKFQETGYWTKDHGLLVITDLAGKILGEITFSKNHNYRASFEIGFSIFREADWGQGFMTQAINLFVPYLFAIKQVNRIEAASIEGNIGSQKVLEKCGFHYEGTARQALFYRGDYVNLKQYAILRHEAGPLSLAKGSPKGMAG